MDEFETNSFSIAVNAKSFRILIDGLYENKIQAVIRELSSNAFDSHIEAGCPEKPFDIHLPSQLNSAFSVRDYGVSLGHEDVMQLYATLFESTKAETNDAVGQLGLGSKSPFAYTSSFTVTAWLDGVERNYLAHLDDDGIPKIRFIGESESDEPQGLKVSFATKSHDYHTFHYEAKKVAFAFDVPPNGVGVVSEDIKPVLEEPGWRLYTGSSMHNLPLETHLGIRQGCVIYPVSTSILGLRYDETSVNQNFCKMVVDVPIGSVEVTASRESLSMDEITKTFEIVEFCA